MKKFKLESIQEIQGMLNSHPVYGMINTIGSLRLFMEHHVYSVWDFMSLVKFLQNSIAPSSVPWGIVAGRNSRRFINAIILEEESDISLPDKDGKVSYASHFEMYCEAMQEVGADSGAAIDFSRGVSRFGFEASTELLNVPEPSVSFMKKTMEFISTGKPHVVAAAFALGREKIIPGMFRQILGKMNIRKDQAPAFYYYLERHIHLDEDFHAPLSIQMLDELCNGDSLKIDEAEKAAHDAIQARIAFWDGVAASLSRMTDLAVV